MDEMEIAKMAAWAEKEERSAKTENRRRAVSAIRQGCDWLLREMTLERAASIGQADADLPKAEGVRKN